MGNEQNSLAIFENFKIRRHYDQKTETWYFSVIDIVAVLTDSVNPTDYLKKLRKRDSVFGNYVGTNCPQIEMTTEKGKRRKTLAGSTEQILRIVQSIPSKKAEPFKIWLAKVGYERVQEITDPAKALDRSREYWQKMGRSEQWIQQRMTGQETRNKLTDYWSGHSVEAGKEFAILTNIIHEEWSELSIKNHKNLKGLKTQNLRDHMSEEELIFTALAELSTRRIAETDKTEGLEENKVPAKKGGKIAKDARVALEQKTGKSVVTGENFLSDRGKEIILGFDPLLVPLILSGEKTCTWRLFDSRDYSGNPKLIFRRSPEGTVFAEAEILSIRQKRLGKINQEDKNGHEPFSSKKELLATYRCYYNSRGDVNNDTRVTVIHFRITKIMPDFLESKK